MSQRVVRVNELLKREISHVLHTRYRSESVQITILGVDTSPNLRNARVMFSTHGDEVARMRADNLFRKHAESIRREVGAVVSLKFLPHLHFHYDPGADAGARINELLDEMGLEGEPIDLPTPDESGDFKNE